MLNVTAERERESERERDRDRVQTKYFIAEFSTLVRFFFVNQGVYFKRIFSTVYIFLTFCFYRGPIQDKIKVQT